MFRTNGKPRVEVGLESERPAHPGINGLIYASEYTISIYDLAAGVWRTGAAGGVDLHADHHALGGIDPLYVQSSGVSISVTDPGHTHTTAAATAANNTLTMNGHYELHNVENPGATIGTVASDAIVPATPVSQPGVPRPVNVSFPAGWPIGSTVTVAGRGRSDAAVTETYTKPAPGGGIAVGNHPFYFVDTITNNTPDGPGSTATVITRDCYAVPEENVTQFLKVSVDGAADSFDFSSTTYGTFEPHGNHHGNHAVDVWYTYTITVTQSSHSHAVNSGLTGITAVGAGHTHDLGVSP